MDKLGFDSIAGVILVSEEMAEMLLKRGDLWRKISPKTIRDELGVSHVCENTIKISYRWGNESSTKDAKIYVSSQLKQRPRKNGNTSSSMTTIHLLVPNALATPETDLTSMVQPNYHLPPQTQGT